MINLKTKRIVGIIKGVTVLLLVFFGELFAQTSSHEKLEADDVTHLEKTPSKAMSPDSHDSFTHPTLNFGTSLPTDVGRGYPTGFGFFSWKKSAWPWISSDFKFIFAGISGDAELIFRGLIASDTHFGLGLNYQTLGRFEEYQRGQIAIENRMETNKVTGRLFLEQSIIAEYAEIAKIRLIYEFGYEDYSRDDDTAPAFILAPSGTFQSMKLNGNTGHLNRPLYSPSGWNLNLTFEAVFRNHWHRWGPPNLWDSPSEFQKMQLNTSYVFSSFYEQKMIAKLNGGIGNGLDRLSAYKIGGSLAGIFDPLVLHGFYAQEIFAEDYGLLNLDYVFPLLKEQEMALHLYLDSAVTQRSDILDHQAHGWIGVGSGVSLKGWLDSQWLFGYGYGINAQRKSDHGGHEVFAQMTKSF